LSGAPEGSERLLRPPYILYFVGLVVAAFLAEPSSFTYAWNQGRSAMLAIVPLVILEAGRSSLRPLDRRRSIAAYAVLLAGAAFYVTASQPSVRAAVVAFGTSIGVNSSIVQFSWVWGIDYTATSVFLAALVLLERGPKTITPLIYTLGMASFLAIDILLPENTLGPFGYIVPPVLQMVAAFLDLVEPGTAASGGNILSLHNSAGAMNLQVFWPSAGLHGIVIGLLVVVAICVKLGTGWTRGTWYLLVGAVGSFLVNVLRLTLLALYALSNITNPQAFEDFHSVAGDLIFIPWIILYVILILRRESRIARQAPRAGSLGGGAAPGGLGERQEKDEKVAGHVDGEDRDDPQVP
jgi:thaumarchaeosortase